MKPLLLLWCALTAISTMAASQGSEKHRLPTLFLTVLNKPVPQGTRIQANIQRPGYWDQVKTQVGAKGRVSLAVKRSEELLRGCRIELFVDANPPRLHTGKPVYYHAKVYVDGRLPSHQVPLQLRTASFLGSGRLLDSSGKPFVGARFEAHITTRDDPPDEDPDGEETTVVFLGSSKPTFLVGPIKTGAQGEFALWGDEAAEPKDDIDVRFDKPAVMGAAWFTLDPGQKDVALKIPALHAFEQRLKLPVHVRRDAYRTLLSIEVNGFPRNLPHVQLIEIEDDKEAGTWLMRCPPIPAGSYRIDLKSHTDHNGFGLPCLFDHPRKQQEASRRPQDWSRKDKAIRLQAVDEAGAPIADCWAGVHMAIFPTSRSEGWYKLLYAARADVQGRIVLDPICYRVRTVLWSPLHRMKVIPSDQKSAKLVLERTPEIQWHVPKDLAKPRKDLRLTLSLVPLNRNLLPQPPWEVLHWWSKPIDETGVARMRIGFPGAMSAWLTLENTKTGDKARIKAWRLGSWRDLDQPRKPVHLIFDKSLFASHLKSLAID